MTNTNLPSIEDQKVAASSFSAYSEYNKTLRTWLVAFGIGGPALFMTNDGIAKRLVATGELRMVVVLFLIGAGVQVFTKHTVPEAYEARGSIAVRSG
jgi:hypothetical protein